MFALIVLDIDGVVTDGRVTVGADGSERKSLDFRDVDAVYQARADGVNFAFLTGEENPLVRQIADRFGIDHVVSGQKDKLQGLRHLSDVTSTPLSAICYVGDAVRDAPALEAAGIGITPADGVKEARAAADYVTIARGGAGCIAEAIAYVRSAANEDADITRSPGEKSISLDSARDEIVRSAKASSEAILSVAEKLSDQTLEAAGLISNAIKNGGKMLVFGNGGSAAEAQHFAGEFVGRFGFERGPMSAIALSTDTSILTALVNDYPPELVFSRQVEALGKKGDVAVGMSTSGNSPNVVNGLKKASELGLATIGMTGKSGGKMREIVSVSLEVESSETPRIQEAHGLLIHVLSSLVEQAIFRGDTR